VQLGKLRFNGVDPVEQFRLHRWSARASFTQLEIRNTWVLTSTTPARGKSVDVEPVAGGDLPFAPFPALEVELGGFVAE
jgi:hypothetical protein